MRCKLCLKIHQMDEGEFDGGRISQTPMQEGNKAVSGESLAQPVSRLE